MLVRCCESVYHHGRHKIYSEQGVQNRKVIQGKKVVLERDRDASRKILRHFRHRVQPEVEACFPLRIQEYSMSASDILDILQIALWILMVIVRILEDAEENKEETI